MNLTGSYVALRNNSKAAMLAAIEIYNKPQIAYRDECFSILLVNAWELLLKAILSKHKQRIYYPKVKGQPYHTFSIQDSLDHAKHYFPSGIEYESVSKNIEMLVTYRNNAIHFYNQPGFGVIIYGLAQTSITNYRDVMLAIFNLDVANEMTLGLLPLSFGAQPDPVEFLQNARENPPKNKTVAQYLRAVADAAQALEAQQLDTARFLTVFKVSLQSVKKIVVADLVVGIDSSTEIPKHTIAVERRVDPNVTHPLRQKDCLARLGDEVNGRKFTNHTFQAIVWKYGIKEKPHLFWRSEHGGLTTYSPEVVAYIKKLSQAEIDTAVHDYQEHQRRRQREKMGKHRALVRTT